MLYSFWVKIVYVLLGGQFLQQVDWLSEVFHFLTVARNCLSWRGTLVSSRVWALAFWFLAGWEWLLSFQGSVQVETYRNCLIPVDHYYCARKRLRILSLDGYLPLTTEWLLHWFALVLLSMTGGVCGWLMGSNEKIQVMHFHKRKEGEKGNHIIKCQVLQVVPLPYSPLAFHSLFLSRASYQLDSTAWYLNLISGCLSEQG